jgi:hypothetical protein
MDDPKQRANFIAYRSSLLEGKDDTRVRPALFMPSAINRQ